MNLVKNIVLSDELVDKLAEDFSELNINEKFGWNFNQYISSWIRGDLPSEMIKKELIIATN